MRMALGAEVLPPASVSTEAVPAPKVPQSTCKLLHLLQLLPLQHSDSTYETGRASLTPMRIADDATGGAVGNKCRPKVLRCSTFLKCRSSIVNG